MFDQSLYTSKVEWGRRSARDAAERGDIVIIVDVLSFSSTVISALKFGTFIYPYPPTMDGEAYAQAKGAEYILGRAEAARKGKPTLSPASFNQDYAGRKYVLSSLNGAFCTWIASEVPALLIGALLNASEVAGAANKIQFKTNRNITVVPCGEQWHNVGEHEDKLRPCIEDYLAAGAILSEIGGSKSPEAEVCTNAFMNSKSDIDNLIWGSGSGLELRERGFDQDVLHCSNLNTYKTVPILNDDHFQLYRE